MTYKFLDHTADVKFIATGKNLEEAFIESAHALFCSMHEETKVSSKIKETFTVEGIDKKSLLLNFLEEFLFLLDTKAFTPKEVISISIDKLKLTATVTGDNAKSYKFSNPVKAITYSEMEIKEKDSTVEITGVFDV